MGKVTDVYPCRLPNLQIKFYSGYDGMFKINQQENTVSYLSIFFLLYVLVYLATVARW